MANSQIAVTEGTGKNIATYSISETTTKELTRVTLNSSAGTELTSLPVSGTFYQATQPVSLASVPSHAVTNAGTFAVQSTTQANSGVDIGKLTANQSINTAQVNGVTTSTGTGVMGTGVQRVAIASDNDAITVKQATGTNLHTVVDSGTVTTVSTITNVSQNGGVAISLNAGGVDTGTRRVIQANGSGKTILSTGGSASSSGNNTLVAAGTNKLKVKAFSLSTTSTTAMTCIFQSGASGTELWRVILQAQTGGSTGANLTTTVPDWLFATASATLLNLNLSSANAVHWSLSYYDES